MRRAKLFNIDALLILLVARSVLSLPPEFGSGLASVTVASPIPDGGETFSATSTSTTANPDLEKRGRWHKYEYYEYYVSLSVTYSSYSRAERFCNKSNGSLALIKSDKIQRFIASLVANGTDTPYGFFIGLRFLNGTNGWTWSDNQIVSYTHWESSHPSDIATNQCVMMGYNFQYTENLPWYTIGCADSSSGSKGLICQRYLGSESEPTVSALTTKACSSSSDEIEGTENDTAVSAFTTKASSSSSDELEGTESETAVSSFATKVSSSSSDELEDQNMPFLIPFAAASGGLLFLVVVGVAAFCLLKRKSAEKNKKSQDDATIQNPMDHEYETIPRRNTQDDTEEGYETVGNQKQQTDSEQCTLYLEESKARFKTFRSESNRP